MPWQLETSTKVSLGKPNSPVVAVMKPGNCVHAGKALLALTVLPDGKTCWRWRRARGSVGEHAPAGKVGAG
eukprot:5647082-Prymnesium_polylepis.1